MGGLQKNMSGAKHYAILHSIFLFIYHGIIHGVLHYPCFSAGLVGISELGRPGILCVWWMVSIIFWCQIEVCPVRKFPNQRKKNGDNTRSKISRPDFLALLWLIDRVCGDDVLSSFYTCAKNIILFCFLELEFCCSSSSILSASIWLATKFLFPQELCLFTTSC
jgi:hypothetical protein